MNSPKTIEFPGEQKAPWPSKIIYNPHVGELVHLILPLYLLVFLKPHLWIPEKNAEETQRDLLEPPRKLQSQRSQGPFGDGADQLGAELWGPDGLGTHQ